MFFSAQKMNELSNCIRDRFNIKQSDFVVLYAPTFRNTTSSPSYDWSLKENELLEAVKKSNESFNKSATKKIYDANLKKLGIK